MFQQFMMSLPSAMAHQEWYPVRSFPFEDEEALTESTDTPRTGQRARVSCGDGLAWT
jgi:hypothetical protein